VAFEERFSDAQHLQALAVKAPRSFQQPAPALAANQVADVVAHDRGGRRERDDKLDFQLALAGQQGGADQRGLAGYGHAA